MVYIVLRFLSGLILKVFFRMRVVNKKYIPKQGGFILASNHVSYLDPIALGVSCPRKLNYMGRDSLFTKRLFSRLLYSLHVFPVKRDSADISALKEAMQRIKRGDGLLMFPEGSRQQKNGVLGQAQSGAAFLAAKLNVPVIPAFVKGTEKALPKHAKFFNLTKISVSFGKEILIERGAPYQEATRLIMARIRELSC